MYACRKFTLSHCSVFPSFVHFLSYHKMYHLLGNPHPRAEPLLPILLSNSPTLTDSLPALESIELNALKWAPRIAESWLTGSSGICEAASAADADGVPGRFVRGEVLASRDDWEVEILFTCSIICDRLRERSSSCLLRSSASV